MVTASEHGWKSKLWLHPMIREIVFAPLAMAAIFRLTFAEFLAGDRSISTFQDNTYLIHPIFSHVSRSFSRGEYPYWIDTLVAGLPLYNSPQFSLTYPLYFFHSGLYAAPLSAIMQIHYVTTLHLFILYLNTYILLRVLRLTPLPSILGATLFVVSANTFGYSVWVNITASYSWFPLVVASVFLVLERRRVRAALLLGTLSLGMLIMASPSQPLIHAVFVIAVLYTSHVIRCLINKNQLALLRTTPSLILLGVLALIISAPAWLPVLFANKNMIRFLGDNGAVIGYAKLNFRSLLTGQIPPANLAGTLIPLAATPVIGGLFVGVGAVLLAMFAPYKARTNWIVWPILFITLYGLLSATGDYLWFARLNYFLPLINKIREPPRHLFLFTLGVSILAAHGFSYLVEALSTGYRVLANRKTLAIVLVFLALLVMSLRSGLTYTGEIPKPLLLLIFGIVVGLLLVLPWVSGWKSTTVQMLAISLIVYASLQYPRSVPKLSDGDYFGAANSTSHQTLAEISRFQDVHSYRIIFGDDKLNTQFWSMNASYYGLRTFQAYMNPVPYKQFDEVFQRFNLRNYYPMLGAKYYLCSPCEADLIRDYDLKSEINGYKLYIARQPSPKYFLINRLAGAYQDANDFYGRVNAGYDYATEAYVDSKNFTETGNWLGSQSGRAAGNVKEERASLNDVRLSVNTQERSIFVLNEYYTTDWKARVNGGSVTTFPVNLNQVGLFLEKGDNTVEFEYHPTLFIWLLSIQRLALLILIVYALYLALLTGYQFLKKKRTIDSYGKQPERQ